MFQQDKFSTFLFNRGVSYAHIFQTERFSERYKVQKRCFSDEILNL